MAFRNRRNYSYSRAPVPSSSHYHVESPLEDAEAAPVVDGNAWQPEPFPEDEEERNRDEQDMQCEPMPATCPLCECLDDPNQSEPNSIASQILDYENQNFGKVSEYTLFLQISEAYNERVYQPAVERAAQCPHLQLRVPTKWSRLIVKRCVRLQWCVVCLLNARARHFENCKHLTTRRRMARLLQQAERLMNLTYQSVRVQNPVTGEVKADAAAAKLWFTHAKSYSEMLIKSKPLLEVEGGGGAQQMFAKVEKGVDDMSMFKSICN